MKTRKMSLGLTDKEIHASIERLDQVFCSLSLILACNLQIFWRTNGRRAGELYRRKLDLTWEQIKRIGLRIKVLDGKPTMDPIQQRQKALLTQPGDKSCQNLAVADLEGEDAICAGIRQQLVSMQAGRDWSSMAMLGEILVEREEIVHQLETVIDDPVLEYIWEDEEMSMSKKDEAGPDRPMH